MAEPDALPAVGDVETGDADAELHALTDDAWREAHERAIAEGLIPARDAAYVWAPGEPVDAPHVQDEARRLGLL